MAMAKELGKERALDSMARLNFSLNKGFGFGIFSIRERLNHVGGSFDVESELGYGTRVTVTAPLKRYE